MLRYISRQRRKKRSKKRTTRKWKSRGGNPPKVFNFYNKYHYGDNILNLKFLYNISEVLKLKNIHINYYYDQEYCKNKPELDRYIHPNNSVTLMSIKDITPGAIELWMSNPIGDVTQKVLDKYYNVFYKQILNTLGLNDMNINTSLYQPEPYLQDIYNKIDPKFHDLDILIINAEPKSGQVVYHKDAFNKMCIRLASKFNVATTMPVDPSIKCTMDSNLMLQDIGAISTHAKYIIGIHSGPVTTCFNSKTKESVKKWILFADNDTKHEEINALIAKSNYDVGTIEKNINEIKI